MNPSIDTCDPRRLSNLLDTESVSPAAPLSEGPGTRIGRYKLLQLIGEGGFGSVFMAEQETPVVRKVALKIIKLGMDTKQVIARFEAERQALAMMDHPHIAKVLDAGSTAAGRPYFVMELVRGIPITEFCDEHKLTTRQRLELFLPVCAAVQHAHQKGIIHRDLKPNNVLVTMFDDKPVPVIIDFGIVKATQGRLTDGTLFTEFRQFIGTPAYMSPEQAQMSALDVDTRSDVYSLGVLLYELLTGATPFDAHELRSAAHAEMQRIIREVEPPRPSTRWSTMAASAQTARAALRRCEPSALGRALNGDLDWIVMKCLEKERSRRYETANGLARDVQRYLTDEPVEASPPSATYKLRKLIHKHKKQAIAIASVFGALLLGIIGTSLGLARARVNLKAAQAAERRAEQSARDMEIEKNVAAANEQMARDVMRKSTVITQMGLRELIRLLDAGVTGISTELDRRSPSDPQRPELLLDRARLYMCLGSQQDATSDLIAFVRARRANSSMLQYAGTALAYLGQTKEYQETCTAMEAQFRASDAPETVERTIKTCLLLPGVSLDLKQWMAHLDRAAERDKGAWLRVTKSLALYREGDFSGCIAVLKDLPPEVRYHGCQPTAELLAAMAYNRLAQFEQSRAAYERSHNLFSTQYKNAELIDVGGQTDWLIYQTLLHEARPLLNIDDDALADPNLLIAQGGVYVELDKFDLAASEFRQAIESLTARLHHTKDTQQAAKQFAFRAELLARVGNFKQAVADYQRAAELAPENQDYWHEGFVPLLLQAGDVDGFSHWRTEELRRFLNTSDGNTAHRVAKDALMLPLDGEDLQRAVELADRAFKTADPSHPSFFTCQTKGMSELRSGKFKPAIATLLKCRELADEPKFLAESEFLLAIAYAQDGDHQEAQAAFTRGLKSMSQFPNAGESCIGVSPPMDWVLCKVLRSEAQSLIDSSHLSAATKPTLVD